MAVEMGLNFGESRWLLQCRHHGQITLQRQRVKVGTPGR